MFVKFDCIVDEIRQLTQQMSEETLVQDDENDTNIENDEDLLNELNSVLDGGRVDHKLLGRIDETKNRSEFLDHSATAIAAVPDLSRTLLTSSDDGRMNPSLIIPARLENYCKALELARLSGEDSKERRYARAIKTLNDQLKAVKNGKSINIDDIPPNVALPKVVDQESTGPSLSTNIDSVLVSKGNPSSSREEKTNEEVVAASDINQIESMDYTQQKDNVKLLSGRRDEYKVASLLAKQKGNTEAALHYFKICKQLEQLINMCKSGQTIPLENLPPSLTAKSLETIIVDPPSNRVATNSQPNIPENKESIIDALLSRMEVYRLAANKAQEENDGSKFRRMSRVQKEYEEAIKATKSGRKVDFSELPTPPGFPPIATTTCVGQNLPPSVSEPSNAPTVIDKSDLNLNMKEAPSPPKLMKQEKQLAFLLERQRQFKVAALQAKKRGDMEAAKNLLRQALGFDQMIESFSVQKYEGPMASTTASRGGLPVNISSTPLLPQTKTNPATLKPMVRTGLKAASDLALDKAYGSKTEATALVRENREITYSNLEKDLIKQLQLCEQNRDYFTKFGDINKVKLFENLGSNCRKELDALRIGFKYGDPVPRCCPDLGFDDLEISIIRGLLLKLPVGYEPKDADIFVKFDLPYPKDSPQSGKTCSIRGTNSPNFDFDAKVKINLKSRQFSLYVKRHGVKFEIYQKGSFLRSDKIMGTCEMKISQLEHKAEIHESLDVMEGRRPAGGKLEVKVRIREPLLNKCVGEVVQEKWLIIDEFLRLPKGMSAKSVLPAMGI
uniref:C2 domain-containing protein n=1 Tax=Romanomermis culicivorax TaxID=13658 RepID=A0A915I0Z7_ROMCU